jgi:hypothetical protein
LREGDVLDVGPFQFRVRWCPPEPPEIPVAIPFPGEADALRIQAAAVAAQQGALIEEEGRLIQRRQALQRQEEQLAEHLEERHKALELQQDAARREHKELQKAREGLEQERAALLREITRDREEAARTLGTVKKERQRLGELRRRLRKRWKKHWQAQESALAGREKAEQLARARLTRERERLDGERGDLAQRQLRLNGDRELSRRELAEQWQKLKQARADWQAETRSQGEELSLRRRQLEEQALAIDHERRTLAAGETRARRIRAGLERESEGLESRIQNLRRVLGELTELQSPSLQSQPAHPTHSLPLPEDILARLPSLELLAGTLSDQRLQLLEQWEFFLQAQQEWHAEQAAFLPQLDAAAAELRQREESLAERERGLESARETLRQKQLHLTNQRADLEGRQARLAASESAWRGERAALLSQLQSADDISRRRQALLDGLRHRWSSRRKEEVARLGAELQRCREAHRHYVSLRDDYERRLTVLGAEERTLAEQRLALERLELELVGKTEDVGAAEKRLLKLRRQQESLRGETEQRLAERARSLEMESARLEADALQLQHRLDVVIEHEEALATRQTEWEHRLAREELTREELQHELALVRRQEELTARQRQELQDEIDRVICVLLQEESLAESSTQAA